MKASIEEILSGVSTLETADLEQFQQKVGYLLAKRRNGASAKAEKMLLSKIREPLLDDARQAQYDLLRVKQRNETINRAEYSQYMKLVRHTERRSVERLRCLVELSQLRGISLTELMTQINLKAMNPANG